GLARLDNDLAEPCRGVDDGVEDRPELRPIRVLSFDELIGGSEKEVRVAETLHHEERLRVAGHTLVCQPCAEALLVVESLSLDASVPRVYVLASPLFQETSGHVPHSLPVTSLGHRNLHSCAIADCSSMYGELQSALVVGWIVS